jgi:S1-C subfamily serine protease
MENPLLAVSGEMADAVERAGQSVVAIRARPRLSASGIYWRENMIVTADHTIKQTEEITVTLPDGRTLPARLAGRDPGTDLAVLKTEVADLAALATAPPLSLRAGCLVLAVGRSEEVGVTAAMGVISNVAGTWRTWRGGRVDQFVRLDLSLYPGSSGGALIDLEGRILGLTTSGLSRWAPMAIPVATLERVTTELLAKGHIARGFLGLGLQPVLLPDHLRSSLQLAERAGLIVLCVEPGGPAEGAGVGLGDVLVSLDNRPLRDTDDVQALLEAESVGKAVQARIVRGGALAELSITIGERPRRGE